MYRLLITCFNSIPRLTAWLILEWFLIIFMKVKANVHACLPAPYEDDIHSACHTLTLNYPGTWWSARYTNGSGPDVVNWHLFHQCSSIWAVLASSILVRVFVLHLYLTWQQCFSELATAISNPYHGRPGLLQYCSNCHCCRCPRSWPGHQQTRCWLCTIDRHYTTLTRYILAISIWVNAIKCRHVLSYRLCREYGVAENRHSRFLFTSEDQRCANLRVHI